MKEVLVDSSVWIDYFRGGDTVESVNCLIDENIVATNSLILAELVPFLKIRRQKKVVNLLHELKRVSLEIDWVEIVDYQFRCLKGGANGVGIPDLIIAQNALQNGMMVYSLDKHFRLLNEVLNIERYTP